MIFFDVQITAVWPGPYGGAIFKGRDINSTDLLVFEASAKVLIRSPYIGELWRIKGSPVYRKDYGRIIVASSAELKWILSGRYLESLLCNHPNFRGIGLGKTKVRALLKQYNPDILVNTLCSNDKELLSSVVTPKIANDLVGKWKFSYEEVNLLNLMHQYKLESFLGCLILSLYQTSVVERIKSNPYALICFTDDGTQFWNKLDKMGSLVGIGRFHKKRLIGAVEFCLYKQLSRGVSSLDYPNLLVEISNILRDLAQAETAIELALKNSVVCTLERDNKRLIQLIGPAYIESSLEINLQNLIHLTESKPPNATNKRHIKYLIELYSEEAKKAQNTALTSQEIAAILNALWCRCSVISQIQTPYKDGMITAIVDIASAIERQCILIVAYSAKTDQPLR